MRVLHLIGGGDVGGAKSHVLSLVKKLSEYIDVKIVSFRPGAFTDDALAMGINIEVVNSHNIISDINRVITIIREQNIDIIHCHGAKANLIAAASKYITGVPAVTTVHSDYRLDYMKSLPKMFSFGVINMMALRFLDYHIGVSMNFKQMLVKRNFDPDNIFIVYNGIDFNIDMKNYSRFEFYKKYNLSINKDDIIVGILARLDPVKGIDVFVNAASEVVKQNPKVKFIIGGDGPEKKSLEKLINNLGIADNVLMPGWITDRYEFMSSIDINVLSSLSESFPYVILEGTLMKKPTISSRVGGVPDLIENGETGFLFTPGDYRELAGHIIKLANDSELRSKMGDAIFKKASSHFSLDSMCNTQLDIYKKILKI